MCPERTPEVLAGPRGFEPPTRPLYPDVSGAYASHRLPIIAGYFLERRTISIGLRHVRRLRLLSGVDFVEQLTDQAECIDLIIDEYRAPFEDISNDSFKTM